MQIVCELLLFIYEEKLKRIREKSSKNFVSENIIYFKDLYFILFINK